MVTFPPSRPMLVISDRAATNLHSTEELCGFGCRCPELVAQPQPSPLRVPGAVTICGLVAGRARAEVVRLPGPAGSPFGAVVRFANRIAPPG